MVGAECLFCYKVVEVFVTGANICRQNGNSLARPYETVRAAETCAMTVFYHRMKAKSTFTWSSKLL